MADERKQAGAAVPPGAAPVRIDPASISSARTRLMSGQVPATGVTRAREPLPFPDRGNMPVDGLEVQPSWRWNAQRWEAYCLLHEGHTTRSAAEKMGLYFDTISNYRRSWKERYGVSITAKSIAQVHSDPRYHRPLPTEPEARAELIGAEHDAVALMARQVVAKWLNQFAGDDAATAARISELSHTEVKAIQEVGLTAQRAAMEAARAAQEPSGAPAGGSRVPGAASASKATRGLTKPVVRKGQKGAAAEGAGATVLALRGQLDQFRQARAANEE